MMRLAILLSGGKDSLYAAYLASREHELTCAITIRSTNAESYMFHTPNIGLTEKQAEAMDIPHILVSTSGVKEKELKELDRAVTEAKETYAIEGLITGAVASEYQRSRVQKLCDKHKLRCSNPLWHMDQMQLLRGLIENNFKVIITNIGAWGFDESWLGRQLNDRMIEELARANKRTEIQVAFEGGEAETLVLDCPLFKKRLTVKEGEKRMTSPEAGTYSITEAGLENR